MTRPLTIRDPLWDTIRVDDVARRIIDTTTFQRLRYIRQLGHAHLVYPGATHTRFDHAVGVHHLARRALHVLEERGDLARLDPIDCRIIPSAALLHDVGHYPFSHALEELAPGSIPGHHEALVGRFLAAPELANALAPLGPDAAPRIEAVIRGMSDSPLQGLVAGSLDLDKIEYLKRDAHFCGVPYGDVDVDRLLHSLALLEAPDTGRREIGVHEKGVAALESLLFAKYQMFRNVYWHHAVRAATVLYKRVVADALEHGLIAGDELVGATDEGLMHLLASRAADGGAHGGGVHGGGVHDGSAHGGSAHGGGVHDGSGDGAGAAGGEADVPAAADRVRAGVEALRARRLPKRAAEVSAGELDDERAGWLCTDSPLKRRVEAAVAVELQLPAHSVYLDFPEKPAMFGLDLLLQRRTGEVIRLGPSGRTGLIGLPRIADELYRSARVLRLYTVGERRTVEPARLAALASLTSDEAARAVDNGGRLLGG